MSWLTEIRSGKRFEQEVTEEAEENKKEPSVFSFSMIAVLNFLRNEKLTILWMIL